MAHHKRKGPKSTRAGCLLCKPHKRQGTDEQRRQEQLARIDDREAEQRLAMTESDRRWEDFDLRESMWDYAWPWGDSPDCEMPEPLRIPLVEFLTGA